MNRIHRLGGDVKYVVLGEPLYFGYKYNKQNACQWPIPEMARKVAVEIAALRADVSIGPCMRCRTGSDS
jgi:hypothetical protein